MKSCDHDSDSDDRPMSKGKSKGGLSSKPMMKGSKAGLSAKPMGGSKKGRTGHELHHHNRPHGMKGPSNPPGY